jgi:hypothetical protein
LREEECVFRRCVVAKTAAKASRKMEMDSEMHEGKEMLYSEMREGKE